MVDRIARWKDADPTWKVVDDGLRWFVRIPDEFVRASNKVTVDKDVAKHFGCKVGDRTPFTGLLIEGEPK